MLCYLPGDISCKWDAMGGRLLLDTTAKIHTNWRLIAKGQMYEPWLKLWLWLWSSQSIRTNNARISAVAEKQPVGRRSALARMLLGTGPITQSTTLVIACLGFFQTFCQVITISTPGAPASFKMFNPAPPIHFLCLKWADGQETDYQIKKKIQKFKIQRLSL